MQRVRRLCLVLSLKLRQRFGKVAIRFVDEFNPSSELLLIVIGAILLALYLIFVDAMSGVS